MVADLGSNLFGGEQITDQVREVVRDTIYELLANPEKGATAEWSEPKSSLSGVFEITRLRGSVGKRVVRIESRSFRNKKELDRDELEAIEQPDGTWEAKRR